MYTLYLYTHYIYNRLKKPQLYYTFSMYTLYLYTHYMYMKVLICMDVLDTWWSHVKSELWSQLDIWANGTLWSYQWRPRNILLAKRNTNILIVIIVQIIQACLCHKRVLYIFKHLYNLLWINQCERNIVNIGFTRSWLFGFVYIRNTDHTSLVSRLY